MAKKRSASKRGRKAADGRRARDGGERRGRAPRHFWSGTISFGLVSVPVTLYPATRPTRPSLRMLAPDGTPLQRRWVCEEEDRDIRWSEIVRAFEADDGEPVELSDEELESVAPRKSRDIDLRLFVGADELDPLLFERAFVLTPGGDSTKAYRLLAEVMEREGKAGIATFVLRDEEHLVAIESRSGILRAETLRFAGELRSAEDVGLDEPGEAPKDLVAAFRRSIRGLEAEEVDLEELVDPRIARLRQLVERKVAKGEDLVRARSGERKRARSADAAAGAGADGQDEDLVEVIRRSLRGAKGGDGALRRGGNGADLASLTKRELYERARELDLAGRSEMTKDELVGALRSRSRRRSR